jgi:hypothetical protein
MATIIDFLGAKINRAGIGEKLERVQLGEGDTPASAPSGAAERIGGMGVIHTRFLATETLRNFNGLHITATSATQPPRRTETLNDFNHLSVTATHRDAWVRSLDFVSD